MNMDNFGEVSTYSKWGVFESLVSRRFVGRPWTAAPQLVAKDFVPQNLKVFHLKINLTTPMQTQKNFRTPPKIPDPGPVVVVKEIAQNKRAGRCIIFTTHYLEEADILANRKAVLAHGRVQAVGTSRDLKQRRSKRTGGIRGVLLSRFFGSTFLKAYDDISILWNMLWFFGIPLFYCVFPKQVYLWGLEKKETGHAAGRPGLGWAWIWFIFMCISETWIERRKKNQKARLLWVLFDLVDLLALFI